MSSLVTSLVGQTCDLCLYSIEKVVWVKCQVVAVFVNGSELKILVADERGSMRYCEPHQLRIPQRTDDTVPTSKGSS